MTIKKTVTFKNPEEYVISVTSVKLIGNTQNFKISKIGHLPLVSNEIDILLLEQESFNVEVQYGVFDLSTIKPGQKFSTTVEVKYSAYSTPKTIRKTISFDSTDITSTKNKSFKILCISNDLISPKKDFQNLQVINSKTIDEIKFYKFLGLNNANPTINKQFSLGESAPECISEINNFKILSQEGFPFFVEKKLPENFRKSPLVTEVSLDKSKEDSSKTLLYFNEVGIDNITGENNFPHPWFYSLNNSGENNLERILQNFNWNSEYWPNFTPLISDMDDINSPTSITLSSGTAQDKIGFFENVLLLNNGYDTNLPSSSGLFEVKASGATTGAEHISFVNFASEWNSTYTSSEWTHKDVVLNQSALVINADRATGDTSVLNEITTKFPTSITDIKNQTWKVIPTGKQQSINEYGTDSFYELWKLYSSQSGLNITENNSPWQPWAIHPPYVLSSHKPSFYQSHSDSSISYDNNLKSNTSNGSNNLYAQTCSNEGETPYIKSGSFSYTDLNGDSNTIEWQTCFAQAFIPISISGIHSGVKDYLSATTSGQLGVNHTNIASISIKVS